VISEPTDEFGSDWLSAGALHCCEFPYFIVVQGLKAERNAKLLLVDDCSHEKRAIPDNKNPP
jgi:hypothetical protein